MIDPLFVNNQITIPRGELRFTYSRSSGPGGQNVNKVNTKATLRWRVMQSDALPHAVRERFAKRFANRVTDTGEVVLQSDVYREQARNTTDCLERLRAMILSVVRPPTARKKTAPTRASKQRRLNEKRQRSHVKKLRQRPSDQD